MQKVNKRPMGNIAHLRKQFKSINTYDYIITLIKRRKSHYLLYENSMVLDMNKLESPSSNDALCQVSWLILAQQFWIKIFKFCQCIFAISLLILQGKGRSPSFEQTWVPINQGYIVPSLVEIGLAVLEKKIF